MTADAHSRDYAEASASKVATKRPHARYNNLPSQKRRRQYLRNNATRAEAVLWTRLKGSQLAGRKFRRQQGLGSYIVDFVCPAEKVVVELDGDVHDHPVRLIRDAERDACVAELDYRVIRIRNEEVLIDIESVLKKIASCFHAS